MRRILATATIAAAAMLSASPAAATSPDGDPVLYWNSVLIRSLPASPLLASRHAAIMNTALHDAINAATGYHSTAYLHGANPSGGDPRAAAAAAAYNVLKALYGNKPEFQTAYAQSLALVADGAAKTAGIANGKGYASQILTLRAGDGFNAVVPYTPTGLPGDYAYTPGSPASAAGTQWGAVTPFLLTSGSQFRPGPPPAIDSVAYANALNEVRDIGAAGSLTRTADQSAAASFWATASGPGPWLQLAIMSAEAGGTGMMDNASTFARLSVAMMDSTIGIFDAKYTYDFWRPVTGIRNASLDNNPLTTEDPGWTPYLGVPNHPSYISGHSAVAAAGAGILTDAFGGSQNYCLTWSGKMQCWDNYAAAAQQAADSRLWGGIHYRFDNEAGLALGSSIAGFTLSQGQFGAAPEPSSWALLITGFGAIGAALRGRRRTGVRFSPGSAAG